MTSRICINGLTVFTVLTSDFYYCCCPTYVAVNNAKTPVPSFTMLCYMWVSTMLSWGFYVRGNNKPTDIFMQSILYLCTILRKLGFSRRIFVNVSNISWKSVPWQPSWCIRTDGRADKRKLTGPCHEGANVLKTTWPVDRLRGAFFLVFLGPPRQLLQTKSRLLPSHFFTFRCYVIAHTMQL